MATTGGGKKDQQPRPVRRKTESEIRELSAPHRPAPYELADAMAIKALFEGTATSDQQTRALGWIIEKAADTHGLAYRPGGIEGQRATDFASGKSYVGMQIIKMVKIPKSRLK